ncbi:hypothetical protein BCR34DRAFT_467410, partial [Clohesyomyces aquaticus]
LIDMERTQTGFRKYISGSKGTKRDNTYQEYISGSIVRNQRRMAQNTRKRLMVIPEAGYTNPLRYRFAEVGYSTRSQKRLKGHKGYSNSNYLMNWMEAIFRVVFAMGNVKSRYFMKQYVICICSQSSHSSQAEILLIGLAEGYIGNGGGFSHCSAGRSGDSALTATEIGWNRAAQYAVEWSQLRESLAKDRALEKQRNE